MRARQPLSQRIIVKRLIRELSEVTRREAPAAGPAACDAAVLGAKEFVGKVFWKKYTEDRRKR